MSLYGISPILPQIAPIEKPAQISDGGKVKQAGSGDKSFSEMFTNAIKEADNLQVDADRQIEDLTLGKEGVTTHGAMIALEKADVAFQLMNTIRSRIITAYQEVMRTQV